MLSQLQFVRIKAAERALKEGRFDEAYRIATSSDLRNHHRAAAVRAALSEKFLECARSHFRMEQYTEALMNLDRAEVGGEHLERIAELRSHVRTVMAEAHRRDTSRRLRLDQARRRIEDGSLAAGKRILEQASASDPSAQALKREIEQRSEEMQVRLREAERLIREQQWSGAVDRLKKAKTIDEHHAGVSQLETKLCQLVINEAYTTFIQGRPSRCADSLNILGKLGASLPERKELEDAFGAIKDAGQSFAAHDFAQARQHAMRVGRLIPKAEWVDGVIKQLQQMEEMRTSVLAGPLGELFLMTGDRKGQVAHQSNHLAPSPDETVMLADRLKTPSGNADQLLLLVDGGGSYLVLRGGRASIGRAATGHPADMPLLSDLAERHAEISRIEEDYFLNSARDVEVGGKTTKHHLLHDGDRITLGRRGKFTFRLPSRKSLTAVIDLSDTTKIPNDVRRVILLVGHAMIGSGPDAHIRCRHAGTPLILFEREGRLYVREQGNGHNNPKGVPLEIGKPLEIGGVSMVLNNWQINQLGTGTA